ncbi:MAG: hypothetical protein LKJ44_00975 [Bifidobacteriaceae bacterium]|nr:hypothetical protein [Bifidobacteriaceae bacterium]
MLVVVLDGRLHIGHEHGLPLAVGSLGVPAGADEVGVDDALTASRIGQDESGAALPAVHAAFEIVVVGLGLFPGHLVGVEHRLDPVPHFGGDQWLVQPVVARATERYLTLVVRVGEHPVDGGEGWRPGGPLGRGRGGQAPVDEFLPEGDGRVVAGGVRLERPLDQDRPVGVRLHDAHFATQLVALGDVEVADGGFAVGAARLGLLAHALGHFVGEVAAVELGDGGHDAVHQHPGGGLVDVLGGGHEDDPGLFQGEMDGHVVGPVAGEPVDLVHDAVGDVVLPDVLDHAQQFGPVGLASGFPGVDELLDDDGVQVAGLAHGGLALGGDREALVPASAFGLLLGGDPQVGHGQAGGLADVIEVLGGWRSDSSGGGHGSRFLPQQRGQRERHGTACAVRLVRKHDPEHAPWGGSFVLPEGST